MRPPPSLLEDDYAPATRSLVPSWLSLIGLLALIAVLTWRTTRQQQRNTGLLGQARERASHLIR